VNSIPLTYVIFDLLALDGDATIQLPYRKRLELLGGLTLADGPWFVAESFDDGPALFSARGMEGIIAKRQASPSVLASEPGSRPRTRRYGEELESLRRSLERRYAVLSLSFDEGRARRCCARGSFRPGHGRTARTCSSGR
jgi:hypothetical protein